MDEPTPLYPWWLAWVVPVSTIIVTVGGGVFYVVRRLMASYIREELSTMLDEKLEPLQADFEAKHKANESNFAYLQQRVDEGSVERDKIQDDLAEVREDVAYLRGRSTGLHPRLPKD